MIENSNVVMIWWVTLSLIGLINIILWSVNLKGVVPSRRWQAILSGGYVFGCAFRSFLPRADVQRICLLDSWLSSVAIGRSVATIAELCFVAQWALVLQEMALAAKDNWVLFLSRLIVPLIFVAEIFSWYATLTTNYLGNSVEESIWASTSLILIAGLLGLRASFNKKVRRLITFAILSAGAYFMFMSLVDVPMYLSRWHQDQLAGGHYLSLLEGLKDVSTRWVVTRRWEDWRTEIPWMSLYFSAAVWLSISLTRMPQLSRELEKA